MKTVLFFLLTLATLSAFPNDKGNGIGTVVLYERASSLEALLEQGVELVDQTFPKLQAKSLSSDLSVRGLELFARSGSKNLFVLRPHTSGSVQSASFEMKQFAWVLGEILRIGDEELLDELITGNEDFYRAMSFEKLKKQAPSPEALALLNQLETGFWIMVRTYVINLTGDQAWSRFVRKTQGRLSIP